MKVAFAPQAERDLEEIGDYIARDNPARARTFLKELHATCVVVGASPYAYPTQFKFGRAIRRAVYRRYLIFYSIREGELRIERILHGARDIVAQRFDA